MSNSQSVKKEGSISSLFKVFYKSIWLVIILVVVGLASGIAFGKMRVKPTYTAKCAVILATSLDPSSQTSNSASTDMSHAKIYLPTVRTTVSAPITVEKANEIYKKHGGEGSISSSGISVSVDSNSDSLIFTVAYSDSSSKAAKEKLESVIDAADVVLNEQPVLSAGEANLIPCQSEYTVVVSTSISKYVLLGSCIGVVAAIVVVLLRYFLDNKIKDVGEFEEIVGADILSLIEK